MDERDEKGHFTKGNKLGGKGAGRPKGALSINDELRKLLNGKGKDGKRKVIEAVAYKILQDALGGDTRLMIEMWQQIDGKPAQNVNLEGGLDNTMRIILEGVDINKFPKPNGS
jgi:hypothetical protein